MHSHTLLLISGTGMKVIQLFISLSLLIVLHEFGHFFFARLFKTRVEKFYLFFDFLFPFSGLLNFALFKKKKGDTEYGIGWFPLGGYVKIAGMVDESMDKEQMALPPQPWEYRSKKAYQRLFIMLGGIIVNVIVAIVLYVIIFSVYGESYLLNKNAKYGVVVDSFGRSIGLQNGDFIRSVDGQPMERIDDVPMAIIYSNEDKQATIEITRNGQDMTVNIPAGTKKKMLKMKKGGFIAPAVPANIDSLFPSGRAEKAGLKIGDSIVAINGRPIHYSAEASEIIHTNYGKQLDVTVSRGGTPVTTQITVPKDSMLGVGWGVEKQLHFEQIHYNPIQAIGKGFSYTAEKFMDYMKQFGLMFKSKEIEINESLGGIGSFASIFPAEFDMKAFLMLTAFVSIILAFMNLLPIPGLDGGYVIFLLWEMITGKQVSEKVMERATTVGLVLLLTLMVYANGLDIFRFFKK